MRPVHGSTGQWDTMGVGRARRRAVGAALPASVCDMATWAAPGESEGCGELDRGLGASGGAHHDDGNGGNDLQRERESFDERKLARNRKGGHTNFGRTRHHLPKLGDEEMAAAGHRRRQLSGWWWCAAKRERGSSGASGLGFIGRGGAVRGLGCSTRPVEAGRVAIMATRGSGYRQGGNGCGRFGWRKKKGRRVTVRRGQGGSGYGRAGERGRAVNGCERAGRRGCWRGLLRGRDGLRRPRSGVAGALAGRGRWASAANLGWVTVHTREREREREGLGRLWLQAEREREGGREGKKNIFSVFANLPQIETKFEFKATQL